MPLNWPTFFTRLGSAIVFSAIMMAGLLSVPVFGSGSAGSWVFTLLFLLIQALCLRDYFRLMRKIGQPPGTGISLGVEALAQIILALIAIAVSPVIGPVPPSWPMLLMLPALLMLWATLPKGGSAWAGIAGLAGLCYIGLPISAMMYLFKAAWYLPLALVLMIWMNDTMAYLVGSFIGRTPFSPISPKKTWEGTLGGVVLTLAGAWLAARLIPGMQLPVFLGLALSAAFAGTAGDLLESKLKRMAGVKDSGALMPGHGGALDRFDSLLIAAPFAAAWVAWY